MKGEAKLSALIGLTVVYTVCNRISYLYLSFCSEWQIWKPPKSSPLYKRTENLLNVSSLVKIIMPISFWILTPLNDIQSLLISLHLISTVDSRYLDFAHREQPLISKWKSGPCLNMEIWQQVTKYCWKEDKLLLKKHFSSFAQYF